MEMDNNAMENSKEEFLLAVENKRMAEVESTAGDKKAKEAVSLAEGLHVKLADKTAQLNTAKQRYINVAGENLLGVKRALEVVESDLDASKRKTSKLEKQWNMKSSQLAEAKQLVADLQRMHLTGMK
jgi:hypothetical protein